MREAVESGLRAAMKARDAARLSSLRMISAAIKERDIEARGKGKGTAADDELAAVLAKMIRQREESARLYDEGGRPELAAKERAEIEVIREFMPQQMPPEAVEAAVKAAIADAGAASPRDMGRVMALLKERHGGAMDFSAASAKVKAALAG